MNKYHAKKVHTPDGVFDSQREYDRWRELKLYELAGVVQELRRQVPYELIPAQYETVGKQKKCVERACVYYADFVYKQDGKEIVEDCKGVRTDAYKMKRKLMLEKYGIRIKET